MGNEVTSFELHQPNISGKYVVARMRDGVRGFSLIIGLAESVLRLSGKLAGDLRTRQGIEEALAEIRLRYPTPDDGGLLLQISTATPPQVSQVFEQVRAVMERDPSSGYLREHWSASGRGGVATLECEVSGEVGVPAAARKAWDIVASIAIACHIHPRDIKSARGLALASARSLHQLKGRQKKVALTLAAMPRAYALNPDAAAIAYAYAPRERGGVAVRVVNATDAGIWRSCGKTGIRPVAPRPWHRDPVVAGIMAVAARSAIVRCAPCQVSAGNGQTWVQALLAQRDDGFEAYIQRPDEHIDHVEVVGWGTWGSLGAETAAQIASTLGQPVGEHRALWLTPEQMVDSGGVSEGNAASPSLSALLADGKLTSTAMTRFRFRVEGAVRRTRDAAILAFLAGLPTATARLARLIQPIRSRDAMWNRRNAIGYRDLAAAVAAASHSDPAAMVRAVEAPSTRALILAAALCGPWQGASQAIASGVSQQKALLLYASAAADRPLSRAAVKSLADWPVSPWHGGDDSEASFVKFADLAKLAAVLWAEMPSRPPMTTGQLSELRNGLQQFGFVAPSVADPGVRTWDDPRTTTAYANALRRDRTDVAGSAALGSGVVDVIRFLDEKLAAFAFARDVREAVRCAILVPPGRLVPGLERMSEEWHRSIARMARERNALLEDLVSEEIHEWGGLVTPKLPDDYPNPLFDKVTHGDVVIRPLRRHREVEREAEELANCVSNYRENARVGDLLLYHLESPYGRSTLGLEVHGSVHAYEIDIYQHYGPQHSRVDASPPPEHTDAASWLVSSLNRTAGGPGGPGWRKQFFASRRAHAQCAGSRPSEQSLSSARQRRLVTLDLVHLGCLLGKNERRLDLDRFRLWAEGQAADIAFRSNSVSEIL